MVQNHQEFFNTTSVWRRRAVKPHSPLSPCKYWGSRQ